MQRRITQVDKNTGEEIGSAVVLVAQKAPSAFEKGRFLIVSQNALEEIASANLGEEALRVFLMLCGVLDFENYIMVSQSEIAQKLNMKRPNVSRAIRRLADEGIIIKGPKVSRYVTYRLNPNVGWKGRGANHRRALDEAQKRWSKAEIVET